MFYLAIGQILVGFVLIIFPEKLHQVNWMGAWLVLGSTIIISGGSTLWYNNVHKDSISLAGELKRVRLTLLKLNTAIVDLDNLYHSLENDFGNVADKALMELKSKVESQISQQIYTTIIKGISHSYPYCDLIDSLTVKEKATYLDAMRSGNWREVNTFAKKY